MAYQREIGEVIEKEGPLVKVRMREHAACEACGSKALCFPAGRYRILLARETGKLQQGDRVAILAASGPAIISALLVFVGPVVIVLGALLLALAAEAALWLTITLPVVTLVAYFMLLFVINKRLKASGWFLPRAEKTDELLLESKEPGK